MLPERYDPFLVVLSFVVAVSGSITALRMGARVCTHEGKSRYRWLIAGALAQAVGIYGMHFTGMLAFILPVPIAYEMGHMSLSFIVAFAGSLLALLLTQRRTLRAVWLIAGGAAIGAGISGLHYTDMAAMRMAAVTRYSTVLVIASIVIACVVGLLSLWFGRRHRRDDPAQPRRILLLSGTIMGIAIVGQHYTGMSAASFYPGPDTRLTARGHIVPQKDLPRTVVISTFLILLAALSAASSARRRSAHALVSQRILEAREDERRRIARGLHEDLGQTLTALRLNLQRLSPSDDASLVEESITLVDDSLARVRALSVELRPSVLDDLGLGAAVEWYAKRSAERAGYTVVVDNELNSARLPELIETAGFRIIQQALTNIARHANARRVRITLVRAPHELELSVRDDGRGFDVAGARARAEAGESLGLLDMRETALLAGGTLSLSSSVGRGTTVRARFPVAA
jgi:signal transduction histidine kinase